MASTLVSPQIQTWAGHGLTITVTVTMRRSRRAALSLSGELDLASAPLLRACLENQLDTGRRYTRVDLSAVTFVDLAGLTALLTAHEAYQQRHGKLVLVALSPSVQRLVSLVGAEDELLISRDRDVVDSGQAQPTADGGTGLRLMQ
jgi:anti-anti-sigma factor